MKSFKLFMFIALLTAAANLTNAQIGGMISKTKSKIKTVENKTKTTAKSGGKTSGADQTQTSGDDSDARAENAKNLAKANGLPKPVNTDATLNKLLFQAADDTRLIPRRVIVVDKDWLVTTGARNAKVRRIFAVLGRTLEDGSGKCGKQMVQFDQDWKEDKNNWGLIYVQNIGEITPIACSAIGK
jgi:hypothetical protein